MFQAKKQREIVEAHLCQINNLLAHAKENDLKEAEQNYISQKLAIEYILRDFDKVETQ